MAGRGQKPSSRTLLVVLVIVVAGVVVVRGMGSRAKLSHDIAAADLRVPPKPPEIGQWAFIAKDGTRPVSYDPCSAIHYVVHVGNGPLNGVSLVKEAVQRVSAATGLTFVFDGMTDTIPQEGDATSVDTPLWIGWANPDETDLWRQSNDIVGLGGSRVAHRLGGPEVYVTGFALLKPTEQLAPGFGYGETEGNVLLHELGHVVGLDHVSDDREIMHDDVVHVQPDGYGPGDLRGLWELGASQGCL